MSAQNTSEVFLITGIPGSGKTVLFSVLTLRYEDRFFPKNKAAQDFMEEAQVLSQQKWPVANNPLAPAKAMQWDFTHNGKKSHLLISDKAGEVWETFVEENQEPDVFSASSAVAEKIKNIRAQLSNKQIQELETIEAQFQNAACVCVMVDLIDDLNGKRNHDQTKFITAIMNYLEKIGRKKCPIALVVTKCKTCGDEKEWQDRFQQRYASFVRKHWEGGVEVIYTDAVADTTTDDNCELVPAPDFSSYGLENLMDWISLQVRKSATTKSITKIVTGIIIFLVCACALLFIPPLIVILLIALTIGIYSFNKHKNKSN